MTTTFVGGLTLSGLCAPMLLDGPMDGEAFLAWCELMLVPLLKPGDIVVMDNLPAHKVAGVREAIEGADARLLYLRPTAPTSIPSRTASQSSRLMCVRLPPVPSRRSKPRSLPPSRHSSQKNAQTSSHTPDTTWINGSLL